MFLFTRGKFFRKEGFGIWFAQLWVFFFFCVFWLCCGFFFFFFVVYQVSPPLKDCFVPHIMKRELR